MDYRFIAGYIRITRCLAAFFIPVLAFTVSTEQDMMKLVIVSVAIVLAIAATYSYNSLMDIKEDRDNPLHPSPLGESGMNPVVVGLPYLFFATSLFIWITLTDIYPFLLFLSSVLFSLTYSDLKIKRFFLVKTLSISLCYMILFFSCYLAFSDYLTYDAIAAGVLICILMFTYSVISDIRDIVWDKRHKLITIPVRYGYSKSRLLIMLMFLLLNLSIALFYLADVISYKLAVIFFMLVPVEITLIYYLHIRDLRRIDVLRDTAFALTAFFMLVLV